MLELWDLREPEAVKAFVTIRKTLIQHKKPTTSLRVVNNNIQIHDGYFYGRVAFSGSPVLHFGTCLFSLIRWPPCAMMFGITHRSESSARTSELELWTWSSGSLFLACVLELTLSAKDILFGPTTSGWMVPQSVLNFSTFQSELFKTACQTAAWTNAHSQRSCLLGTYWILWPRSVFRPQPILCHSSLVN